MLDSWVLRPWYYVTGVTGRNVELSDALLLFPLMPGREATFFVSLPCLDFTAKKFLFVETSALDCIVDEFILVF